MLSIDTKIIDFEWPCSGIQIMHLS